MEIPSLVVDRDNNIYVVAREFDGSVSAPDDNDLWFAYYNGSVWSETNVSNDLRTVLGKDRFNEYYLDLDIESPVVGTRQNTTDHVLMTKVIGGLHVGKVIYLKWDGTKWDYEKDPDAGTDSQYYVSLERRSPAFYTDIAYLFYDRSTDKLNVGGDQGTWTEHRRLSNLLPSLQRETGNRFWSSGSPRQRLITLVSTSTRAPRKKASTRSSTAS